MLWERHGHFQQEGFWLPTKKLVGVYDSKSNSFLSNAPICKEYCQPSSSFLENDGGLC